MSLLSQLSLYHSYGIMRKANLLSTLLLIHCLIIYFISVVDNVDKMMSGGDPSSLSVGTLAIAATAAVIGIDASGEEVKMISSGLSFNCVLFYSGRIKCFGSNSYAALGQGVSSESVASIGGRPGQMGLNLPFVDLGNIEDNIVDEIYYGALHSCGLMRNRRVKCWGFNHHGQLGVGLSEPFGSNTNTMGKFLPFVNLGTNVTISKLSLGAYYSCALFTNGKVKCFGDASEGSIGSGSEEDIGIYRSDMGDNLPFVDFGTNITVLNLFTSSSSSVTCILTVESKAKCIGNNAFGQLGYNDTRYRGASVNDMGDNLPYIDFGTKEAVVMLSIGNAHTCALFFDDRVKCWGYNTEGQLGLEDKIDKFDFYSTRNSGIGPKELPYLNINIDSPIKYMCLNYKNTCVVYSNSSMKCWGVNGAGELGLGHSSSRGGYPNQMGKYLSFVDLDEMSNIIGIFCGSNHYCVIFEKKGVKCWGLGTDGQLGNGATQSIGDAPNEMGKNLKFINFFATLNPTYSPTSTPTRKPSTSPIIYPTRNPSQKPTNIPTQAPTYAEQFYTPIDYFLFTGLPILIILLVAELCGKTKREKKLLATAGFSIADTISDIAYIALSPWSSETLRGVYIYFLLLPCVGFVWGCLKYSPIRLPMLRKYTHKRLDELFKVALFIVATTIHEIAFLLFTLLVFVVIAPIIIIIVPFHLSTLKECRRQIFAALDWFSISLGFSSVLKNEDGQFSVVLNLSLISQVIFESLPKLIIAIYNNELIGINGGGVFAFTVMMSTISLLNNMYPILFTLFLSNDLRSALEVDRFSRKAPQTADQSEKVPKLSLDDLSKKLDSTAASVCQFDNSESDEKKKTMNEYLSYPEDDNDDDVKYYECEDGRDKSKDSNIVIIV